MSGKLRPNIAILVTCFNRRESTLAALARLPDAVGEVADYQVFLVDDGSTDGTSQAVNNTFPDVRVLVGNGNLYWNGGMRVAWEAAISGQFDFYLWLNDDTELRSEAIADMVRTYNAASRPNTIVVGCTTDPTTGELTYGGYRRVEGGLSGLRFRRTGLDESYCDTMNGNCVLFPAAAAVDVGINSVFYRHAFGDNDYGLRARKAGYDIVQLNTPIAQQEKNTAYVLSISKLTVSNWKYILFSPKGVPMAEWFHFCREHGGWIWPVNFVFRYIKMGINGFRS